MSKMASDTLDLMDRLRQSGEDFCVATVIRTAAATSAKAGAKAVVTRDGAVHGFIGGGCVTGAVKRVGLEALADGKPRMIRVKPKEDVVEPVDVDGVELHTSSCPSGGTVDIFFEPMRQAARLVVCGASPVATTLATIAVAMGYRTIVAAREEDLDRFSGIDETRADFDLGTLDLGDRDAVVVATQGKRDREALKAALSSGAGYVGIVGSRRKIAKLLDQVGPEASAAAKAALHGPAGLDIGAIEPEEIALSILGEIVKVRRQAARARPSELAGGEAV
ncbi:XdhC family protein [Microbaculum sp. FT89]|uniref:XdhC family protein n=1 Tax=Microbaculum sp. FT89 TaxID=3447298 RepID=UPI003F537561